MTEIVKEIKIKLKDTKQDVDKEKSERRSAEEQKEIMKNEIILLTSEILQLRTKNAEQLEVIIGESAEKSKLEKDIVTLREEIQNLRGKNESYEQVYQERLKTVHRQIQMLVPTSESL